jgi:hypothetical protein
MAVRISREADGRVSIELLKAPKAVITAVEARLLAIKLLLAAEELRSANLEA